MKKHVVVVMAQALVMTQVVAECVVVAFMAIILLVVRENTIGLFTAVRQFNAAKRTVASVAMNIEMMSVQPKASVAGSVVVEIILVACVSNGRQR